MNENQPQKMDENQLQRMNENQPQKMDENQLQRMNENQPQKMDEIDLFQMIHEMMFLEIQENHQQIFQIQ
jgi:hypothetical protein